ncbi:FAD-dependent oxidoreductase [Streptomyces sp. NA04227]|uniref:NAD(P)/FAD-dependent oxidoreductase n=1 Tax=Streptomyces sp. NA04227 TaxID=2742136 RepID=UPI001590C823|nr:FAD-dependent oxidoreductase [Streptomyces sp. NA04227]QKW10468.1 FAD-dependent oxidoreductase [Streptomyces sp. NA04227]
MPSGKRRIAVIGSGIAGLTAAYILAKEHDVTLYEADGRLGGHAHTHELTSSDGGVHLVDSGFIVHNRRTYPNLLRLFAELDVDTQPSEMSMSVSCEGCGLQYAGALGLPGVFAQPANLGNPRFLRMLAEVPRFHRAARRLLGAAPAAGEIPAAGGRSRERPPASADTHAAASGSAPEGGDRTLSEFLTEHRFSPYFVSHFATPLVSCVWSCDTATARRYPARYLFAFLEHHGMLSVSGSPQWRTVTGGSRTYVERIAKEVDAVRPASPVRAVVRHWDGVEVVTGDGAREQYDSVVLATHPRQALRMLARPTAREWRVLGTLEYAPNTAVLHTDTELLPGAVRARASWNYLLPSCEAGRDRVRVSYDMNRLQRLDSPETFVVTLGGEQRVRPEQVLARMHYEHPIYTPESVAAQRELPSLGDARLVFAGAYHGWGFHEDGCRSGAEAARRLGVPW